MVKYLFTLDGYDYDSKEGAKVAIRNIIKLQKIGSVFGSPTLSDLFARYHPYCQLHKVRPTLFRKDSPDPESGWNSPILRMKLGSIWTSLSWHTAIDGTDWHTECKSFLRWKIIPIIQESKKSACEECGSITGLEVDHAAPTFSEIFEAAKSPFPGDIWAYYQIDRQWHFQLPDNHPVVKKFMALHATARLVTLCKPCHVKITKDRMGNE